MGKMELTELGFRLFEVAKMCVQAIDSLAFAASYQNHVLILVLFPRSRPSTLKMRSTKTTASENVPSSPSPMRSSVN